MKKYIAIILMISLLLSLTFAAHAETAYYPVEIADHAGRAVVIDHQPQRIVSGYYISSSALIALGLADNVVGIEAKAEKRPIYGLSAPQFLELPNVGTAKEFNLEGCLALEPDLVILPIKLKEPAETLEQMGISVLLINPESREAMIEMLNMIGDATNTRTRAEQLNTFISGQAEFLNGINDAEPTVYLGGNSGLLSTAGEAMYQSHMIDIAGGVNVAAEIKDTYWAEISYEQLLAWDPEYIVLASDAVYTVDDVLADENLAKCTAVINGNVVKMPGKIEAWDSPVPGGILGSVWLASVLHPDAVSGEYVDHTVNDFYTTFYGYTVSEE